MTKKMAEQIASKFETRKDLKVGIRTVKKLDKLGRKLDRKSVIIRFSAN